MERIYKAIDSKYNSVLPRPTHEVPVEVKRNSPEWSLSWMEYIYTSYIHNKCGLPFNFNEHAKTLRSYAMGDQDRAQYKKTYLEDSTGERPKNPGTMLKDTDEVVRTSEVNEGWVDMDFDNIFSPMPKLIFNMCGIMESQDHDVVVNALDKQSSQLKDDIKYSMLLKKELKSFNEQFSKLTGIVQPQQEPIPVMSIQEIELFDSLNMFKLPYEIALQRAIDHTNKICNKGEVKRKVIVDLFTLNKAALMDRICDTPIRRAEYEYIDVANVIIEATKERDFKNSTFCGYPTTMTPLELMEVTGWDEESVLELTKTFVGVNGNDSNILLDSTTNQTDIYQYNKIRIPVMYAAWRSKDTHAQKIAVEINAKKVKQKEIESGKIYEVNGKYYKNANDKNQTFCLSTIYEAWWVIGTDKIFKFGQMQDIPYDFKNKEPLLPIHVISLPGTKSIVENCIPVLDSIEYQYLRYQNAIIKAPPAGLSIELSAISDMTIDGKPWKAMDTIRLHSHTGNVIYELKPPQTPGGGSISSGKPIEELRGGLGTAVADTIQSFELLYQQLTVLSGIDSLTAVTQQVSGEQPLGTTKIQVQSTSNTIKPIYSSYIWLFESVSKNIGFRIQLLSSEDDSEENYYYNVLGSPLFKALVNAGKTSPVFWSIYYEAQPTSELKQEVRLAAQAALAGGKNGMPMLEYSEYLFIVDAMNTASGIKWARAYLAYKEGKAKAAAAKQANDAMILQSQEKIKADKEQLQNELIKDRELTKNKIFLLKTEEEEKRKTLLAIEQEKHKNKMAEIQLQGKIDEQVEKSKPKPTVNKSAKN